MKKNLKSNKGFTLVELLVVFMVTTLLLGGMFFYTRSGERQIILFQNQMKVVSALQRAKTLAIGSYGNSGTICGYGVSFQTPGTMIIFKDSSCNNIYSGSSEDFETVKLDRLVQFTSSNFDVVFIPPDPTVAISNKDDSNSKTIIIAAIADGQSFVNVKITDSGQITTTQ